MESRRNIQKQMLKITPAVLLFAAAGMIAPGAEEAQKTRILATQCNDRQAFVFLELPKNEIPLKVSFAPTAGAAGGQTWHSIGVTYHKQQIWSGRFISSSPSEENRSFSGTLHLTKGRRTKDAIRQTISLLEPGKFRVGDAEVSVSPVSAEEHKENDMLRVISLQSPFQLHNIRFLADEQEIHVLPYSAAISSSAEPGEFRYSYELALNTDRKNAELVIDCAYSDTECETLEYSGNTSEECSILPRTQPDALTLAEESTFRLRKNHVWHLYITHPIDKQAVFKGISNFSVESKQGTVIHPSPDLVSVHVNEGLYDILVLFHLPKGWEEVTLSGEANLELISPGDLCEPQSISLSEPGHISADQHTIQYRSIAVDSTETLRSYILKNAPDEMLEKLKRDYGMILELHSSVELDKKSIEFYDGNRKLEFLYAGFHKKVAQEKEEATDFLDALADIFLPSHKKRKLRYTEDYIYTYLLPADTPQNIHVQLRTYLHHRTSITLPFSRKAKAGD